MELQELRDRIRQWKAGVPREDGPRSPSPEPQMSPEHALEEPVDILAEEPVEVATEEPVEVPVEQGLVEQGRIDPELSPAVAEALAQSVADGGMANTTAEILDPALDVDVIEADVELEAGLDGPASAGAGPAVTPEAAQLADSAREVDPEAALEENLEPAAAAVASEPATATSSEPVASSEPAQAEPPAQEQPAADQQAIAEQQAAVQALYAKLSPEHLAALQQYGQQLQGQGYSPEQIATAQYQYAQQMIAAMQQ